MARTAKTDPVEPTHEVVFSARINIRAEPDVHSDILGVIEPGTAAKVSGLYLERFYTFAKLVDQEGYAAIGCPMFVEVKS